MSAHDSLHQAYKYGGATSGSAIATVTGPAFDIKGMEEVLAVVNVGVVGAGTLDVTIEDSANGTTGWSALTGAVFTQIVNADDNKTYVGRIVTNKDNAHPTQPGPKQFLRFSGVVATAVMGYGAGFIGGGLHDFPVAQDQTVAFNLDETAN